MYDMEALILCWNLLVYVGLKVASKVVKENWEQGIHGWHEGSNIYKKACSTCDEIHMTSKSYVNET